MNITRGKIKKPSKVVVYGPEGIGKSTFASMFPEPLFADTEGSTKELDVARFDKPSSWTMLNAQIDYVISAKPCKTFVVDTIDWAEQLCIEYICSSHDKKGIEDFGYGNGYVYEKEEFGRFLNHLDDVIDAGINVVLTAHAQLRKFEQPDEMGAYDRWELKLGKKTGSHISPLVKEWADMVLFANYKTMTVQTDKDGKKFKAQGGKRVMYTTHHPCWDAKNRFGLPEEMPFDYAGIAHIFNENVTNNVTPASVEIPTAEAEVTEPQIDPEFLPPEIEPELPLTIDEKKFPDYIPKALADLMKKDNVTEDDIRLAVSSKGYFPYTAGIDAYGEDFINGCLVGAWPSVLKMIKDNKASHPLAGN